MGMTNDYEIAIEEGVKYDKNWNWTIWEKKL